MHIVVDIPEELYKATVNGLDANEIWDLRLAVTNGIPLTEYTKELKRRLFMEVDGGTGDNYLRYADVCDRISNTIDTYINAGSEVSDASGD